MFNINKKADYGLILISELVGKHDFVSRSELVSKTHLPPRFIARIAADLVRSGILQSKEGKDGGYKLIKNLKEITLYEFLNIFNKKIEIVKCQKDKFACEYGKFCSHKFFFKEVLNNIFLKELRKWSLANLITSN